MTVRLTLLCSAASTERDVRFGADAPLDERALREARAAAGMLPVAGARYTGPSQRCRQTAQALGWNAVVVEPALRDLDMGSWQGRTLDEVAAGDGAGLAVWMSDPDAAPHGGESVADVCRRIAAWLDALPADAGQVLSVVEQAVARAAVVHALGAPQQSFWRIDVPPLAAFQLTGRGGRWNLRMVPYPLPRTSGGGQAS
ncbi:MULTISPECIES: histidine phosphatase family protein [unclassified Streptomyces]|uniref:histidine phosphatase family protein n=1 Tax=unclassified Streptomyces TaxID=2593676 RepID=UPI002365EB66|nr:MULTISPECIES: histidine phosphatase family protein [unclassified Streptomyces]MDF3140568.1 histidine phosphatase family protein [Streptomyces sp. T21Q-yed]WDF44365.1 histidine phosphatase family protein [Streptomyces sp. T12]